MQTAYQARRDLLVEALRGANLRPYVPRGTYFVLCDIVHLGFPDDVAFCRYLTTEVGVTAIPPSLFYSEGHRYLGQGLARFSFCKSEETLREAAGRLQGWEGRI